jgi:SPP1 gp7 family putative phage head morphogenesis protein
MRQSLAEQVRLITSLPREAAARVHKLTTEALVTGSRAAEIAREILNTGEVTESRAKLIARTEVSRTATALTQARAQHVGSEGYIWRTSRDGAVRRSHKAMEGRIVRWNEPPELDGMVGHAGEFPNCRCFVEPILPDRF